MVRQQPQNAGKTRQLTQIGAELIAAGGLEADVELACMAASCLQACGLSRWKIAFGSVKPLNLLLAAADLSADAQDGLLSFIHSSDFVGLDDFVIDLVESGELDPAVAEALKALPRTCGGQDALDEACNLLARAGIDLDAQDTGIPQLSWLLEAMQTRGWPDNAVVDFSILNSFDYYTGLVFALFADGVADPVGSGGRYDDSFAKLGCKDVPAAGFALCLEHLLKAQAAQAAQDASASDESRPLRIAVPKGSLFEGSVAMLEAAGFDVEDLRNPGRHLIVRAPGVEYVIVRPTDAPAFVASGGADCGICGRDSLIEAGLDLVQLVDLGFGSCRFVVAQPADAPQPPQDRTLRIATKYPRITREYYRRQGQQVEIVHLHGNIELGPIVGLSDRIVDITATGTTLRENNLEVVDTVLECNARFFASPASVRCDGRVARLAARLAACQRQ